MAIESNLAGVARVAFEAQTAEFNRDVDKAERVYVSSTDHMSDSAIKLELAQDRLRRELARGPNAARSQARALLAVRQAERDLTQETDRNTRAQQRNQREVSQTARGAIAGSGAFRGLGRSIAFASGTFLGTAGLVAGIRKALEVGSNLNEQTTKTEAVFGTASGQVLRFAKDALGQANDQALETASSIGALLRPVGVLEGDAAKVSIRLTKLGTDLSSFYNTDVSDALTAIRSGLVGESEPLRKYGVQLNEARVQAIALADSGKDNAKQLTTQDKLYARIKVILKDTTIAQGDYARTIGGAANQERELQKNLRNTEALLGGALQPAYRNLLRGVNDWLSQADNQKRVQQDVNTAIKTGTSVVKGLAEGLRIVKSVAEPVVDALGGIEKAAQAALILGIASKARKAALGFAPLQASSAATAEKGVRDAAVFGRAWDVATRPRNMVVTGASTGGGAVVVGGGGRPAGRGGRLSGLVGTVAIVAGSIFGPELVDRATRGGHKLSIEDVARSSMSEDEIRAAAAKGLIDGTPEQVIRATRAFRARVAAAPTFNFGLPGFLQRSTALGSRATGGGRTPGRRGTRPTGDGLTGIQRLDLAASRAQLTADLQDDLRAARDLEAHYAKIASNEKLKGDKLFKARQDLIGAQQRTQAVEDQIASDRQAAAQTASAKRLAAADKLAAERKAAAEKLAAKRKAEADRVDQAVERANKVIAAEVERNRRARVEQNKALAKMAEKDSGAAKRAKDPDTMTRDELGGILRDFMSWAMGIRRDGSNVTGGNLGTQMLEQLTMTGNLERTRQTQALERIASGGRGPRRELDEAVMAW